MSDPTLLVEKRKIGTLKGYDGICHNCNSPVLAKDEIVAIEFYEDENLYLFIPIDKLTCTFCLKEIGKIIMYKAQSLDITAALSEIKNHE